MNLFLIAIGGALGAVSRYGVDLLMFRPEGGQTWPWGTFVANMLGCLLVGVIVAWVSEGFDGEMAHRIRSFLLIGFIGSFTTFSTFVLQSLSPTEGLALRGVVYAVVSVVLGMLLCAAGLKIGKLV